MANSSAYSSFRVYASVFSVFFRVNPWLMLLLGLLLPSVANLLLPLMLPSVANSSAFYASSLKPESI